MRLSKEQLEIIKSEMEQGNPIKVGAKKCGIALDSVKSVRQQLFDQFGKKNIQKIMRDKVMPSKIQMAKNLSVDSKEAVKKSFSEKQVLTKKDEYEKRLSICNGCDFFDGERCSECGCFMKIKARFHGFECPRKYF
jgi:hypothetical protein